MRVLSGDLAEQAAAGPALDHLSGAVSSLLAAGTETQLWRTATDLLCELTDADGTLGLEFVGPARAVFRAESNLPDLRINDPFPVAPDSQAAFVVAAQDVVRSDLEIEDRFAPAAVLVERGSRSSISIRLSMGDDVGALLGCYSRRRSAFSDSDVETLRIVAAIAGSAISELRARTQLEANASRDVLTGVWNRRTVLEMLSTRLAHAHPTSVLMIDLDGFKGINDRNGHGVGDRVLQVVARRVERTIDARDLLGRLGGDEFIVVVDGDDRLRAERLAASMVGAIEEVIRLSALVLQVSASTGIAFSRDGDEPADLLRRADQLMYEAKRAGSGRVRLQTETAPQRSNAELMTTASTAVATPPLDVGLVDEAIAGLRTLVQPIVCSHDHAVLGAEALTRGPAGHQLEYPDLLFTAANTFGRLGALEMAAKRASFELDIPDDVALFINVEPRLLATPGWLDRLHQEWIRADRGFRVIVEVTERDVLSAPGRLIRAVQECKKLGWGVALDDVGNRTESLAAVRWLEPAWGSL